MKLLDLFCGGGGAAMGYSRAGFTEIVGVDIEAQPDYPFHFVQADALAPPFDLSEFDLIHASPPCQAYSTLNAYNQKEYPDLVSETRGLLRSSGRPWVIENVPGAPIHGLRLCGRMFGLPMYRHRVFESSHLILTPEHPPHDALCARNGYLPTAERPLMSIHGGRHSVAWREAAAAAMECEWMSDIKTICEAIPPAYTEWIGHQMTAHTQGES